MKFTGKSVAIVSAAILGLLAFTIYALTISPDNLGPLITHLPCELATRISWFFGGARIPAGCG